MKLSSVPIFAFVFVPTSVFVILLFVKKSGGFIAPTGIFLEVIVTGTVCGGGNWENHKGIQRVVF